MSNRSRRRYRLSRRYCHLALVVRSAFEVLPAVVSLLVCAVIAKLVSTAALDRLLIRFACISVLVSVASPQLVPYASYS